VPGERVADAGNRIVDEVTGNTPPLDLSVHSLRERATRVVCQRHYHLVN
jgi:hypothetical protein